jgi:Holliday junction resolvase RusA-like endonuclease
VAERVVRAAWEGVGEPRLEGAIYLDVSLHHERPAGHFTKAGALSAEGARHPWPDTKKPDVDNALKLVMDALNTRAWRDDKQVVRATVIRCWALRAHTLVQARRAPAPHPHL